MSSFLHTLHLLFFLYDDVLEFFFSYHRVHQACSAIQFDCYALSLYYNFFVSPSLAALVWLQVFYCFDQDICLTRSLNNYTQDFIFLLQNK